MSSSLVNIAAIVAALTFRDTDTFGRVWRQKTPYKAPEPDHAAHIARAEEKRRRKAAKLARLTLPNGGSDADA